MPRNFVILNKDTELNLMKIKGHIINKKIIFYQKKN